MNFTLESVTVQYDAIPALDGVDCTIDSGAAMLLTGATGAGKTTFLKLLYADVIPTDGTVSVDGNTTRTMKARQLRTLRTKLGIMFQDARLMPTLSVYENVMYPLMIAGWAKMDANKRCLEVLADIGISYIRDKYPKQLSGGEKHLANLARAVIHTPDCILADEPTGNVDAATADTIARVLRQENTRGATLVIAT
ncbi:MAG: ATP-binding cassette domain-containing protein, partial [Candidatus Kapabacteria bacterium]|nr:ATP-binding cassette domain-containing protein [Candidatus Kapabacteria bacterium]